MTSDRPTHKTKRLPPGRDTRSSERGPSYETRAAAAEEAAKLVSAKLGSRDRIGRHSNPYHRYVVGWDARLTILADRLVPTRAMD
ncbi:hypothetical protein BRC65_02645 [Halobacteriales archaeon QH_2_65_14]|nr:MAG: hypothetical protein BRC65_02645 [Halobacteriales archaeon QH_2_65_14]